MIEETYTTGTYRYIRATTGKTSATVSFEIDGDSVRVCNHNAANKVWGGQGKLFSSIGEALNNYKSAAMKAIIFAAAGTNA